ncbi:MAG: MarR family transcriptional regulator [Ignavibacteriales bacterium]|nr:MarR family transcriptional regulator [Ignavibacteriales bacterium]
MPFSIFNPSDQLSLDRKIAVGLERISQALKAVIWEEAKKSGLSPIQIQFLTILHFEKYTAWTIGELANRSSLTPATVSDAVTSLEQKGLVARRKKGEDRRTVYLNLTDAGRKMARKLGGWANVLQESTAGLPEQEKAVFLKSLMTVMLSLQGGGHLEPSHMCITCKYFRPNAHRNSRMPHHCATIDIAFGDSELRVDCPDYKANSVEGA